MGGVQGDGGAGGVLIGLRRSPRHQSGQAIVLVAFMIVVLLGTAGLALDGANAYLQNVAAERAAAAAALSGAVFMPNQFTRAQAIPGGTHNDATDRALDEAARNGFSPSDPTVSVAVATTGSPSQLKVTVTRRVPTFLMAVLGVTRITVSRSAIADYLSPISIGQPGQQVGSTVSQLGAGNNFWSAVTEGWKQNRMNGDAFTPDPCVEYGGAITPCASDQHQISGTVADPVGTTAGLPPRGGYNWLVTIPPGGGTVWVYNAVHGPSSPPNNCENSWDNVAHRHSTCNPSYSYREDPNFLTMKYTLFSVPNVFLRDQDSIVSTLTVKPINADSWNSNPPTYTDPDVGDPIHTITQGYDAAGAPTNMSIYRGWIKPDQYTGSADGNLVRSVTSHPSGALAPGTYRLRVDTLNGDGTIPAPSVAGNSTGLKTYAVGVAGALATYGPNGPNGPCSGCVISAWNDLAIETPVKGSTFRMKSFQLPKQYAGQTVLVDIYDPGDVSGNNTVTMEITDPLNNSPVIDPGKSVHLYDLGRSWKSTPPGPGGPPCAYSAGGGTTENVHNAPCVVATGVGNPTRFTSYVGGVGNYYNGHWVRVELPVSASYDPGATDGYWSIVYNASAGITATDVLTFRVGLKGAPVHLLSS